MHNNALLPVFLLFLVIFFASSCRQSAVGESQGDLLYARADSAAEEGDVDKACQLLLEALESYQKEGSDEGAASSLLALAQMKTNEMQVDTAMIYIDKALTIQVSDSLHASILSEKGAIYFYQGNMRQVVNYVRKAMQEGEDAFFGEEKAVGCGNAAVACRRLAMPDSARFFLEEGIKAAQQVDDDEDLAFLYNNLATYLSELKHFDEALDACHHATEAASRAGEEIEGLNAMVNEGFIYYLKGDEKKSLQLLEEVLVQIEKTEYIPIQAKVLTYLLKVSIRQGDATRVSKYLDRSEQLLKQLPPTSVQGAGLMEEMIDIRIDKSNYASALHLLEQVEDAIESGSYPRDAYLRQKASIMAGLGDHRQAYALTLQSIVVNDSLRGMDAQRQLSELSAQLKAQERETEIARLNKAVAQRQFYITLFAAGLIILALLAAAYIYWLRRRKEQVLAQRYVEGLERERARFARELHDGACNELLGIGMVINTQQAQPQDVAERIRQLRDTLRHISHELMPPQFDKATLDENLGYYLQHSKTPTLDITFTTSGDFSTLPRHIAYELYRITQEAVGNIISHASATKAQVVIDCGLQEVNLSISDNGHSPDDNKDFGDNPKSRHHGIGLQSISDRVKSIGADLHTDTGGQGTTLSVHVPL